jgi:hypothetical protein
LPGQWPTAGDRLALVDPSDASRVDVWDAGSKRLVGFRPYGARGRTAWVGGANGRLVTLGGGKLTGWDVPACKAVFEVDGGYAAPAHLPPGRAWVVAATAAHADVIDTATGKVLGRCAAANKFSDWKYTALAPDGRTLLRVRHVENPGPGTLQETAHVWDLTTGREGGPVAFGIAPPEGAMQGGPHHSIQVGGALEGAVWADSRRFLGVGRFCHLVDLEAGATACVYRFLEKYVPPGREREEQSERPATPRVSADPAGGVWVNVPARAPDPKARINREWRRVAVPNPAGAEDGPLAAADRTFPFRPGSSVRVEVDLGTTERGRKLAERVAGLLQREGYTLAPGGWTVRVTYGEIDAAWGLDGPGGPVVVPAAELRWDVVAPDGTRAWRGTTHHGWGGGIQSKYYVRTRLTPEQGANTSTTSYDFGLRSPRAAIPEEILDSDDVTQPAELPTLLPRAVLHAGGAYHPLPRTAELPVPAP